MVFVNTTGLMLIFLFYSVDISMADQRICTGKNINTMRISHDNLACKEGRQSAFCIPPKYNRDIGPWQFRHLTNMTVPWMFTMEFDILDVQEIGDEKLTITFDVYFKIKWIEPRSQINVSSDTWRNESMMIDGEEYYLIPRENMDDLWTPALEMYRLELYQPQKVHKEAANLRINREKGIRYIVKEKIVLSCKMKFDYYPFDNHTCFHRVGSFDYPKEFWDCSSSVQFNASQQRSLQYNINITDIPQNMTIMEVSNQTWATCGFKIDLMREKGQIFLQVYLTSSMLVALAWVSFIVPPDVVPGRMGLLVTVFLMLITIFVSVKRDAPPSNDFVNASDMFVIACISHVFLAFIEYAFVLFRVKKAKMASALVKTDTVEECDMPSIEIETTQASAKIGWLENENNAECPDPNQLNGKWNPIDLKLLCAYPLSFATFCLIYFSVYLG